MELELFGQWSLDSLPSSALYNNTYNEVWGYSINGFEYAIIGSTLGTHFIDVTDPGNPQEVFFVKGTSFGNHIVHRDYHEFNGYLYAVSDEDLNSLKSTLQIIDLSNLPNSLEVVYESSDLIRKCHNIFIDRENARLYSMAPQGGSDPASSLRIYDISNPIQPSLLKSFPFNIGGVALNQVYDAYVKDHIGFLNCGFDGFMIVDFSDFNNEELLTHLEPSDYANGGYNHSGWPDEEGQYYYMADENWGLPMKVFDISDLRNIELVNTFDAESSNNLSIPHNQIVKCNMLYSTYYYDGLQVFELSDPENPRRIAYYPTSDLNHQLSFEGAWGVYPFLPSGNILVSDMQNGLFILENPGEVCQPSNTGNQLITDQIRIYPNPAESTFYIDSYREISSLKIYNLEGKRLMQISSSNIRAVDVSNFERGAYIVVLNSGNEVYTEKLIIRN